MNTYLSSNCKIKYQEDYPYFILICDSSLPLSSFYTFMFDLIIYLVIFPFQKIFTKVPSRLFTKVHSRLN